MINLIRAEFSKVSKNRLVVFFTIGLLPTLAFVLLNLLTIFSALRLQFTGINQVNWHEQVILTLLFANQLLSQSLFIIFAAVSFGGESRWNTWKNILPRNQRHRIILSKFIVIAIMILIATQGMAIVTIIGSWEIATFSGVPFVSGAWNEVDIAFEIQYLCLSFSLFANFMLAAIYASIAAIQTQSTSGGIVLGVLIAFADTVSQPAFAFISRLLGLGFIASIPSFLPNHHIQNILAWITTGETVYDWTVSVSSLIIIFWIIGGISLALWLFQRRDID